MNTSKLFSLKFGTSVGDRLHTQKIFLEFHTLKYYVKITFKRHIIVTLPLG